MALKATCLHLEVNVHYLQTRKQKLFYMLTLVLFLEFITSRYFIEQATQNGVSISHSSSLNITSYEIMFSFIYILYKNITSSFLFNLKSRDTPIYIVELYLSNLKSCLTMFDFSLYYFATMATWNLTLWLYFQMFISFFLSKRSYTWICQQILGIFCVHIKHNGRSSWSALFSGHIVHHLYYPSCSNIELSLLRQICHLLQQQDIKHHPYWLFWFGVQRNMWIRSIRWVNNWLL